MSNESNISNIDEWRPQLESINGIRIQLGHMSLEQLVSIESACKSRVMDAQTDLWIVADYIARLYPDGGSDTAA